MQPYKEKWGTTWPSRRTRLSNANYQKQRTKLLDWIATNNRIKQQAKKSSQTTTTLSSFIIRPTNRHNSWCPESQSSQTSADPATSRSKASPMVWSVVHVPLIPCSLILDLQRTLIRLIPWRNGTSSASVSSLFNNRVSLRVLLVCYFLCWFSLYRLFAFYRTPV